jgi:hypothetical protein
MATNKNKRGNGEFVTSRNPFGATGGKVEGRAELAGNTFFAQAVDAVVAQGCAILIGATRDGGAWVVTVLDGDERHRAYAHTAEELDSLITSLISTYKD